MIAFDCDCNQEGTRLIEAALRKADPYAAPLGIGHPRWRERLRTLRSAVDAGPAFLQRH